MEMIHVAYVGDLSYEEMASLAFAAVFSSESLFFLMLLVYFVSAAFFAWNESPMRNCLNMSHLGHLKGRCKRRKWNRNVKSNWYRKIPFRGWLFLGLMTSGMVHAEGMDAQTADRVFQRMMEMTEAATRAATLSGALLERFQQQSQPGSGSSGSRFDSKI